MESKTNNYDYKQLLLDIFQNDKQIYKNAPLLIENLQIIFILTIVQLIAFFPQYIISIYQSRSNLFLPSIENISILCNIYLMRKSFNLLTLIKRFNHKDSLVSDLLAIQIVTVLSTLLINGIIFYTVLYFNIDQSEITTLIIFMTLLSHVLISNQLKFLTFFLMEVWLCVYSFTHWFNELQFLMLVFLHVQILINVILVIIKQTVLVGNQVEMNERVELSQETMHDLRNQVQSQIELNKMQEKDNKSDIGNSRKNSTIRSYRKDHSNAKDSQNNKNNDSVDKIDFSNSQQLKIIANKKQSQDNLVESINKKFSMASNNTNIDANNESLIANFEPQIQEESKRCNCRENYIMRAIEFENMDGQYQQKFILYKISFLYHIELIFGNLYNQNPTIINVRDMLYNSCETLQIIFMNKSNSIHIHLHTFVSQIRIDEAIFQYLLVEIIKLFHDQGQSDINIKIMITPFLSSMNFILQVNIPDISSQTVNEVSNKHIIKKLIESLYSGAEFKQIWVKDGLYIDISLPSDYKEIVKDKSKIMKLRKDNKKVKNRFKTNSQKKESVQTSQKIEKSSSINNNNTAQSNMYQFKKNKELVYSECIIVKTVKETKQLLALPIMSNKLTTISEQSNQQTTIESNIPSLINKEINQNHQTSIKSKLKNNSKNSSISKSRTSINKQNAINELIANVEHKEVAIKDNLIYVNVDDELNILKMNKRIFSKEDIPLNTCTSIDDFANFLINVQLISRDAQVKPCLLGVMDHMLDREWGYEAIDKAHQLNLLLDLDLSFVLLSSTEDKETLEKQTSRGVIKCVSKPLNKGKLKPACELFRSIKVKENKREFINDGNNEIMLSDIVVENQASNYKNEREYDDQESKKVTFGFEKRESRGNQNKTDIENIKIDSEKEDNNNSQRNTTNKGEEVYFKPKESPNQSDTIYSNANNNKEKSVIISNKISLLNDSNRYV